MKYFEWRGEKMSQFVLGAAQLGMNYGIANQTGQPNKTEAFNILDEAAKNGVTMIDTAQAYGNSEKVIGEWVKVNNNKCPFYIISKWNSDVDINDEDQLKVSVRESVQTLGGPLWGMMIHDEKCLDQFKTIAQVAKDLKEEGVFKYLGASVYSVEAAKKAIEIPSIDFIQVPCNAWDHRMIDSGIFEYAKEHNVLCFVRSVFLQGLLIMSNPEINIKFSNLKYLHQLWDNESVQYNISKEELAIEFVKKLKFPLVFGIELSTQLKKNINILNSEISFNKYEKVFKNLKKHLKNQGLDPRKW